MTTKVRRLQFELPEDSFKALEELMNRVGLRTKADLLDNALTLFEWAIEQRQRGRIIASVDEKDMKYQELLMPVFTKQPAHAANKEG